MDVSTSAGGASVKEFHKQVMGGSDVVSQEQMTTILIVPAFVAAECTRNDQLARQEHNHADLVLRRGVKKGRRVGIEHGENLSR